MLVTTNVEQNVICSNLACLAKAVDDIKKSKEIEKKYGIEFKTFLSKAKVCDNCLRSSTNSHRCSSCLSAQYCSKECLLKDWDFHKSVCSSWAGDEKRQMPGGGEQVKILKKLVKSVEKVNI